MFIVLLSIYLIRKLILHNLIKNTLVRSCLSTLIILKIQVTSYKGSIKIFVVHVL